MQLSVCSPSYIIKLQATAFRILADRIGYNNASMTGGVREHPDKFLKHLYQIPESVHFPAIWIRQDPNSYRTNPLIVDPEISTVGRSGPSGPYSLWWFACKYRQFTDKSSYIQNGLWLKKAKLSPTFDGWPFLNWLESFCNCVATVNCLQQQRSRHRTTQLKWTATLVAMQFYKIYTLKKAY